MDEMPLEPNFGDIKINMQGTRIYSIREINEQINKGFNSDFRAYLERCPQYIRERILKKTNNYEKEQEFFLYNQKSVAEVDKSEEQIIGYLEEVPEELNEEKSKEFEKEETEDALGNTITIDSDELIMSMFNYQENPYADMDFRDRLNVEVLYLNITAKGKCIEHNASFNKIQTVIKLEDGKRYSSMFKVCKQCKKLYISDDEWKEFKNTCIDRGIKYNISYVEE